jgi:hypothetical protein
MSTSENETLREAVREMAHYFWVEQGWENFRAEFLSGGDKSYQNARRDNARSMAQTLDDLAARSPALRTLIMEGKAKP